MTIKIDSLHIYPLKSAQAINMTSMDILNTGPKWDREWMLIDRNNNFISQRNVKEMCLVNQEMTDKHLVINAPGMETLLIPLEHNSTTTEEVSIFNKKTIANLVGNSFDDWFSDYTHQKVRLVRSPDKPSRFTSGNHGPKTEILFPDGYPLLLTLQETLDELNSKLDTPVDMNRFRPNVVVSGAHANDEESWKTFKVNNIEFDSVKSCTRCSVITVDQNTGKNNNNIVRILNTYRKKDGSIIFGRNLIHNKPGSIKVGETIHLI